MIPLKTDSIFARNFLYVTSEATAETMPTEARVMFLEKPCGELERKLKISSSSAQRTETTIATAEIARNMKLVLRTGEPARTNIPSKSRDETEL